MPSVGGGCVSCVRGCKQSRYVSCPVVFVSLFCPLFFLFCPWFLFFFFLGSFFSFPVELEFLCLSFGKLTPNVSNNLFPQNQSCACLIRTQTLLEKLVTPNSNVIKLRC